MIADMKGDKKLFVWGPNRLNNKLLASQISEITGVTPVCVDDHNKLLEYQLEGDSIIFCDCDRMDARSCCIMLGSVSAKAKKDPEIVLLNIDNSVQLIDEITEFRIKGIFYSLDSWNNINKGLKLIYQGEHWLPRKLLVQSLNIIREQPKSRNITSQVNLTRREIEILTHIAAGLTNKEIADRLFISLNTVKTHVGNIFKKIGVSNRVQAILWVAENFNPEFSDTRVELGN